MNEKKELEGHLRKSAELLSLIQSGSFKSLPANDRNGICLGLYSAVVNHHMAITKLLILGNNLSAFALIRVITEAAYRCVWVQACASDAKLTQLMRGKDIFPDIYRIATELDNKSKLRDAFKRIFLPDLKILNDHTHGGILCIASTYIDYFTLQRILWAIKSMDQCLFVVGSMIHTLCGDRHLADQIIRRWMEDDKENGD